MSAGGEQWHALRTASIGVSTAPICGVRDHAERLADALAARGCPCSTHWLERRAHALGATRAELGGWLARLPAELRAANADVALLHYSVFAFSFRGVPLFVRPVLDAVRRARLPLVTILHEFVYPWRRDGLRGATWAVSQRALLSSVVRSSDAVVTTTDFQADWLARRPWLAKRPSAVAPVFSNVPEPSANVPEPAASAVPGAAPPVRSLGLFGYAYGAPRVALVLDALAQLAARGEHVRLSLLGAPGPDSASGEAWRAAARARGLADALELSGTLAPHALADALAACELLLFIDPIGPNSRKTTLAASLAAGRPVLALDGPRRWRELSDARAVCVVAPAAGALASALSELLGDAAARAALAARGREFARTSMSVERAADAIAQQLGLVAAGRER
jgi:glycosyltransferase involved in cell wall biosynthesis